MRCQTQHDYGTRLLIEEKPQGKKSRMKVGKEPHAAREPRVGHPCYSRTPMYSTKPLRQYTQEEKLKSFSVTLRNTTSTSIVFFFFRLYKGSILPVS